jgi:hypothetical protein
MPQRMYLVKNFRPRGYSHALGLILLLLAAMVFVIAFQPHAPSPTLRSGAFYPLERNEAEIYRFAQPHAVAMVVSAHQHTRVTLRVDSPQPLPARLLHISVDNRHLLTTFVDETSRTLHVLLPIQPSERPLIPTIAFDTQAAVTPNDQRPLGMRFTTLDVEAIEASDWQLPYGLLLLGLVLGLSGFIQLIRQASIRVTLSAWLLGNEQLAGDLQARWWYHSHTCIVATFLAIVLIIPLGRTLTPEYVLSPADMIYATPFFADYAPPGFARPSNATLSDQPYQFVPWRYIAWRALRDGRLPLWDANSLAGKPFLATQQHALFYPINVLLTVLPFGQTFGWSAFLRLLIAGLSMYLLARQYRLCGAAALFAALSFMLCGFFVVWLNHPHTNVAIWLPALVLATEHLLHAKGWQRTLRVTMLLTLLIAVQFTGGHAQTTLDLFFALGMYYLLRWLSVVPKRQRFSAKYLALLCLAPLSAVVMGACLAAVHLLPFLEWLPLSEVVHARAADSFVWHQPGTLVRLQTLLVVLFPNLYGNPTWSRIDYLGTVVQTNYNEIALYCGVLPVVSACAALSLWRQSVLVRIWVVVTAVALGRALQLPIFDWINQLPIFTLAEPARARLIAQFGICLLAGFGLHWLIRPSQVERQRVAWVWGACLGGTVILGALLPWWATWLLPLSGRAEHLTQPYLYLPTSIAAVGLCAFFLKRVMRQGVFAVTLLGLTVVDLLHVAVGYNPVLHTNFFFPQTPIVTTVLRDQGLYRFGAARADLIPETQALYELADIRGLDFRTRWYEYYWKSIPGHGGSLYYTDFLDLKSPLIRVLNLKYIATARPEEYFSDDLQRIDTKGKMALFAVRNPTERAFMVYDSIVSASDDETAALLQADPRRVYERVILDQAQRPPKLAAMDVRPQHTARLLTYQAEQSAWEVSTTHAGFLFISDAYYPGWKAVINGQPTQIYRANLAFRAIAVPPGKHVVQLRYEPISVRLGLMLSGFSVCTFVALLWWVTRNTIPPQ